MWGNRNHYAVDLVVALTMLAATAGCGGNASPAAGAGTNVPLVSHEAVWQATLIDLNGTNGVRKVHGQVIVDANAQTGSGSFQFSGEEGNAAYGVQYCYAPVSLATCHLMLTSTTDANGDGSGSFRIPTSEPWINGRPYETVTVVIAFAETQTLIAAWSTDASSSYSAPLYKTVGQADQPPTSGRATVAGTNVHVQVRGAIPNTTYTAGSVQQLGASSGSSFGQLTTDGSGNADQDFVVAAAGFGIYLTPGVGGDLVDGVRTR